MSRNLSKLSGRKGLADPLFERLTHIGAQGRTPTAQDASTIASDFNIGKANVHGAATFYEFLTDEHLSKKAFVCNGSACLCAGTQTEVEQKLVAALGAENVGHMTCLGRCHENSAFHIAGHNYSGDAIHHLDTITQQPAVHAADGYRVSCSATQPVLTGHDFATVEAFRAAHDTALALGADGVLAELKTSGLRGRGGAGFPTGIKWESCRSVSGDEKYVVCNADEGDPGAYSDRYLLEQQPLRVLFGMLMCGWIIGAQQGVVYIRAEYPEAITLTQRAIDLLHAEKLLGDNILGTGINFDCKIIKGAGAYICGEETALIASIEGRRAEVDVRPPFPTVEGLYKKPTVVNNVESFAALPFIVAHKGAAFAAIGTGKSTGTKLVSLDGGFKQPGIVEVAMGTPLASVLNELGGGFRVPTKALHIGGPLGGLVPVSKIAELHVDFESFAQHGFLLGHASVVCVPESFPLVEYIQHLFAFTAAESCGKCFPCRLGSMRGEEMFTHAIDGTHKIDRPLLNDLLDTLQQGSLCALGGGLPLPIRNALQYFEPELSPYFSNRIA